MNDCDDTVERVIVGITRLRFEVETFKLVGQGVDQTRSMGRKFLDFRILEKQECQPLHLRTIQEALTLSSIAPNAALIQPRRLRTFLPSELPTVIPMEKATRGDTSVAR